MPGSVFSLDDDLRSLMVRAVASLERVDLAVAKVIVLAEQMTTTAEKIDQMVTAVQKGLQAPASQS